MFAVFVFAVGLEMYPMFFVSAGPPLSSEVKDWSTSPATTTLASTASRVLVPQISGMWQVAWLTVNVPEIVVTLSAHEG